MGGHDAAGRCGSFRPLQPSASFFSLFSILNILQDEGFEASESILHVVEEPAGTWRAPWGLHWEPESFLFFYFYADVFIKT